MVVYYPTSASTHLIAHWCMIAPLIRWPNLLCHYNRLRSLQKDLKRLQSFRASLLYFSLAKPTTHVQILAFALSNSSLNSE